MSTLHDLPPSERPRERLLKHGAEALSLQELLAIILGRGTKNEPIMNISQKLLSQFGSVIGLENASAEDLVSIKGIGLAKACQLKACFELKRRSLIADGNLYPLKSKDIGEISNTNAQKHTTPDDIYRQVRQKIVNFHKEHLLVVSLDSRSKIIGTDIVSVGTLNSSLIHPREVFETAIRRHAAQIILCHNHPSGELKPSNDDLQVTKNIKSAGDILGIPVIDHLIVTTKGFLSFKTTGFL